MGIIVKLDRIMINRKIKLLELAEKIGITYSNLSNLKNGKVTAIRFSTLENICRELNCQPGDILEFLDDNVIKLIDSYFKTDIEKEGALTRLHAYAEINGEKNITTELAKKCFKFNDKINIDNIVNVVANYFNINIEQIKSNTRINQIVKAKHIILYLCRTETEDTFKDICNYFNIDTAQLIFACDKISDELKVNKQLQEDYNNIIKELKD